MEELNNEQIEENICENKKKKVPGKKVSIIAFIISLAALVEKLSLIIAFQIVGLTLENLGDALELPEQNDLEELAKLIIEAFQISNRSLQLVSIACCILGAIGIILFLSKKKEFEGKKKPTVFAIIAIAAAIITLVL